MKHRSSLSDNIGIDPDKCTFCGICVDACVVDNLRLQLAPCRQACPLHTNCHGYVQLIARGKFDQALAVVREGLPFPGIIGRICSHPCEVQCERVRVDGQPVAIRALKRFLDDHEQKLGLDLSLPSQRSERVAIIGSGPAGMMAAWDLRKLGYGVVVFEATAHGAGLLWWGIPEFRLPRHVVEREFGYLDRLGVNVRLNTAVGRDVPFRQLLDTFDAVFVATGARGSRRLHLAGEAVAGVYHGLEFLRAARENADGLRVGPRVTVIGGGNVAVDAAQTALRLGGTSVRLVCLETREQMPAFGWEIEDALAEGVELVPCQGPSRFVVQDGQVQGVEFKACTQVFNAQGEFSPRYDEAARSSFETDTVIVAIGQEADADFLAGSDIQTRDGWILADPVTCQTSVAKVFAGGDAVSGPQSVVEAMADGKAAAQSIHRLLREDSLSFGRDYLASCITEFPIELSGAAPQPRVTLPRNRGARRDRLVELEDTMSEAQAVQEAGRCLSCGLPEGYYRSCWYCLPCEIACPEEALTVNIPYLVR